MMCAAALLLALTVPSAAYGQSDGFFSNVNGARDGNYNGIGWNGLTGGGLWGNFNNIDPDDNTDTDGGGSWGNFNNTSPEADLGGGLALLTVAGFGYACVKRRKMKKQELH